MSRKANADNKEVKTKLQQAEDANPFVKLTDAFGGIEKLPDSVKPIQTFEERGSLFGPKIVTADPRFKIKGVGSDEEVRMLPGSDAFGKDPKFYVSKKGAPGLGSLPSFLGGVVDTVTFQKTDLDKLGREFDAKPKLIDLKDPKNYQLSDVEKSLVENQLESAGIEPKKSALEKTDEYIESLKKLYGDKELRKLRRDAMREETIQNQLNYMATEPVRQAFLNRAAEQAAQRGLRIRGALEAMPSNIQNIMLSKQAQAATASSAEAERARAAADQQDAATRFASLGMQRRFG